MEYTIIGSIKDFWHKNHTWRIRDMVTLDTLFKNSILDLRLIDRLDEEEQQLRFTYLLRLAIDRFNGWVSIYFPRKHIFGYFATIYIAEKTPNVSCVVLPCDTIFRVSPIYIPLLYWKQLKVFHARLCPDKGLHLHIISQVANCCNISELGFHGNITEKEVLAIVEGLPKLRILDFSDSTLSSKALLMVLDGKLKYLYELNVLHCLIKDVDGKDIGAHMDRLRDFKKELLNKACNFKGLKKFIHCFGKSCEHCKDKSLASK
ncbi:hypothetical protein DKX38_025596 [Salix brachista]|uniref:FBD domain-containing protein n=1 Tax=Salix brachista TaxID=2182728 RepID=A0A5N5K297_9ROSI|nr:hypothetical protein DKX38_025596 [Salix brachista]